MGDRQIGDRSSPIDGRGRYYHYYIFERLLEIRLWMEGAEGTYVQLGGKESREANFEEELSACRSYAKRRNMMVP